jgi:hypothetical protein
MTIEQVQQYVEVAVAGAVCVGLIGTAVEAFGEKAGFPKLVKVGRALEDFATNVPRLLGREKPRT